MEIVKFAHTMLGLIEDSNGKDNGESIKDGDFGFFRNKTSPRIFLKHPRKDFVESFCLCSQCHFELGRNDKAGFGYDVNQSRKDYVVVGNLSQINTEGL